MRRYSDYQLDILCGLWRIAAPDAGEWSVLANDYHGARATVIELVKVEQKTEVRFVFEDTDGFQVEYRKRIGDGPPIVRGESVSINVILPNIIDDVTQIVATRLVTARLEAT